MKKPKSYGPNIRKANPLPKCNGRPQLWAYIDDLAMFDRLRIVYPDGKVQYASTRAAGPWDNEIWYGPGCTSADTQEKAVKKCIRYFGDHPSYFLGYL